MVEEIEVPPNLHLFSNFVLFSKVIAKGLFLSRFKFPWLDWKVKAFLNFDISRGEIGLSFEPVDMGDDISSGISIFANFRKLLSMKPKPAHSTEGVLTCKDW